MNKLEQLKQQIDKETLYNLYIIENKPFDKLFELLEITRKDLRRLLTEYNIKKSYKLRAKNNTYKRSEEEIRSVATKSSDTQKKYWENRSESEKLLWARKCSEVQKNLPKEIIDKKSDKYRAYWYGLSKEEQAQINSKRSESCKSAWCGNTELIAKQHRTREVNLQKQKLNLCRTKSEQKIYDRLIVVYPDLKYDIKVDDRYPFYCDFYIPSKDLFIEFQGHPSHGRLPYEYLSFDEYSKYPTSWQDVFANRDIIKENYIKENHLNFIRFYPNATLEENLMINKNNNKELIELLKKIKLY